MSALVRVRAATLACLLLLGLLAFSGQAEATRPLLVEIIPGPDAPDAVRLTLTDRDDDHVVDERTIALDGTGPESYTVDVPGGRYRMTTAAVLVSSPIGDVVARNSDEETFNTQSCPGTYGITVEAADGGAHVTRASGCRFMPATAQAVFDAARAALATGQDTMPFAPTAAANGTSGIVLHGWTLEGLDASDTPRASTWFSIGTPSPLLAGVHAPDDARWVRTLPLDGPATGKDGSPEGLVLFDDTGAIASTMPRWERDDRERSVTDPPHGIDVAYGAPPWFPLCLFVPLVDADGKMLRGASGCVGSWEPLEWHWMLNADGTTGSAFATWHPRGGTVAARLDFHSGNALPIAAEVVRDLPSGTSRMSARLYLSDVEVAVDARWLPVETPRLVPPPSLAAPDAMTGPALGAADAFAFPLGAAVQAARDDPLLAPGLARIDMNGGLLAGAVYGDGSPLSLDGEAEWKIVFSDPNDPPLHIACSIALLDVAAGPDCRREDPHVLQKVFGDVPQLHRRVLPERTSTWDHALAVWQGDSGADPLRQPDFALYRAWDRFGGFWPATVAVGDDLATRPAAFPSQTYLSVETGKPTLVRLPDIHTFARFAPDAVPADVAVVAADVAPAPPQHGALTALQVAVGAALTGVAFAVVHRLRRILPLVPLWARRDDLTDRHPLREDILGLVRADPGVSRARLKEALEITNGQLEHHLGVLLSRHVLFEVRDRGMRRFFVTGSVPPREAERMVQVAQPHTRRALDAIRETPGIGVVALAEALGVSKGYASKLVRRLESHNHIRAERTGNRVELYVASR